MSDGSSHRALVVTDEMLRSADFSVSRQVTRAKLASVLSILAMITFSILAFVYTEKDDDGLFFTWMAIPISVVLLVARVLMPGLVIRRGLEGLHGKLEGDELAARRLALVRLKGTSLSTAFASMIAFFNLTPVHFEASVISLVIIAFCALMIAFEFPTERKVSTWIDNRLPELSRPLTESK